MKTILVSGASGVAGYGILRSLRRSGKDLRLVGTTIYDDSVAEGFCDIFELACPTHDAGYLQWLTRQLIKRHTAGIFQHEHRAIPVARNRYRPSSPCRIKIFS